MFEVDIVWKGERLRKMVGPKEVAEAVAVEVRKQLSLADLMGHQGPLAAAFSAAKAQQPEPAPTVSAYAETWKADNATRHGWKKSTLQNYESLLKRHILPTWRDVPLDEISRRGVKDWLALKDLAPKTIVNLHRCLSSIVSAAVDDEILETNPILRMGRVLPKVKVDRPKPKAWTLDELVALLDTARQEDSEHYSLYVLMAKTGVRIGEAIALRWSDVDFSNHQLTIDRNWVRGELTSTKGRRYRSIELTIDIAPVHPPVETVLTRLERQRKKEAMRRGWGRPSNWVHHNSTGECPLDPDNLRARHWKALVKEARVPDYGFHGFRHTFATHLLLRGDPIYRVSRMLGHSSVSTTTDIYGHVVAA